MPAGAAGLWGKLCGPPNRSACSGIFYKLIKNNHREEDNIEAAAQQKTDHDNILLEARCTVSGRPLRPLFFSVIIIAQLKYHKGNCKEQKRGILYAPQVRFAKQKKTRSFDLVFLVRVARVELTAS